MTRPALSHAVQRIEEQPTLAHAHAQHQLVRHPAPRDLLHQMASFGDRRRRVGGTEGDARSLLDSTGSTATICLAPACRAPRIALAPMPPTPTTTIVSAGPVPAVYTAEPHPVTTPHPRRQARSSGTPGSILMQLASLTTVCLLNVPRRHMVARSRPRAWCRTVIADLTSATEEGAQITEVRMPRSRTIGSARKPG